MRLLIYLFWWIYSAQCLGAACDPNILECKFRYRLPGDSYFLNYFSNFDLEQSNPEIKRAILVVHGNHREAQTALKTVYSVTKSQGRLEDTLIVAPWFKGNNYGGKSDCSTKDCDRIEPGEVYWTTTGWKIGDRSLIGPGVSSFEVADLLIKSLVLSKRFSSLKHIVVTGHSAGGQYTQRYAIGTQIEQTIQPVQLEYVIANPSSYLYLDSTRPTWAGLYAQGGKYPEYGLNAPRPLGPEFIDPYFRKSSPFSKVSQFESIKNLVSGADCYCNRPPCPYERYKYGFEMKPLDSSHYMTLRQTSLNPISRYLKKKVTYLLGQLDNLSNDDANAELDVSCSGNFQGPDRLTRGTYYFESLKRLGPHNHTLSVVAQVGHNAPEMYHSYKGRRALFGGDLAVQEYLSPTYTVQIPGKKGIEHWIITKIKGDEYTIQDGQTLLYFEGSPQRIHLAEYKNSDSQRWIIQPVLNRPNSYSIKSKSVSHQLVSKEMDFFVTF